jgi:hypothetical protein
MSLPPLSQDEKQRFFNKTLERMRIAFWKGRALDPSWPQFVSQCNLSIDWARWDNECRRRGMHDYVSLPQRCNYGGATQAQEDMLKEFLTYLLSVKTTKTFADLM